MKSTLPILLAFAALAASADQDQLVDAFRWGLQNGEFIMCDHILHGGGLEDLANRERAEVAEFKADSILFQYHTNSPWELAPTLTFEPSTNWTGIIADGKELGYVATNHVLTVIYYNGTTQTNRFTLRTTQSGIAKWRTPAPAFLMTNAFFNVPWIRTNSYFPLGMLQFPKGL